MSAGDLEAKSGVSFVQIYNIESGRTQNPRKVTRDRLANALGEKIPDGEIAATEKEAEVADLGPLEEFDPHDNADRPHEPGVYVFYDVSERPVYVGESGNIAVRITSGHYEKFWFKQPLVETAAYIRVEDPQMRKRLEQILIRFLRSHAVLNKQYVIRDPK